MFKKLIIFLAVIAPAYVFAQDKIAYINTQEIFLEMPEIRDVESKMATKQEEINKNVTAMQTEYNNMLQRFQESEDISQSAVADRQKQMEQFEERYNTYLQNSAKEYEEYQNQLVAPIQQKLQKAIQDVGAESGYTYIIEAGALVFRSDSATDAGPQVRAKLGIR